MCCKQKHPTVRFFILQCNIPILTQIWKMTAPDPRLHNSCTYLPFYLWPISKKATILCSFFLALCVCASVHCTCELYSATTILGLLNNGWPNKPVPVGSNVALGFIQYAYKGKGPTATHKQKTNWKAVQRKKDTIMINGKSTRRKN